MTFWFAIYKQMWVLQTTAMKWLNSLSESFSHNLDLRQRMLILDIQYL